MLTFNDSFTDSKMCPLFSPYVLFMLFVGPIFLLCSAFTAKFEPNALTVHMEATETANLTLEGLPQLTTGSYIQVVSGDTKLAQITKQIQPSEVSNGRWTGTVDVVGVFLGQTNAYAELVRPNQEPERAEQYLSLTIIRLSRAIDHAFTGSVIVLVSLLYVNFGAALDLKKLKGIVTKPIGPAIGFCMQFIVMPLVSENFRNRLSSMKTIFDLAQFRSRLFALSAQYGYATWIIFHRLLTGRKCFKHMDGGVGWKYGLVDNDDIDQYTCRIWYDAILVVYFRQSDI